MRLHLALGLVVVVTLAGCGGGEKGRSEDAADASPSADVLKSLIGKHEKIAGPVVTEVPSNYPSMTAKTLASFGLLEPVERGDAKWGLTEQGRTVVVHEKEFTEGIPVYYFAVGERKIVEIAGVRDFPGHEGIKQAEFTYRVVPTELGRELVEAGVTVGELTGDRIHRLQALLILHEEGWRVERVGV